MKNNLTKRDWLFLILIAIAVIIQGLLESNPNH